MRVLTLLALIPAPAFACAMPYRPPVEVAAQAPAPTVEEQVKAAQLKAAMAAIDAAMAPPTQLTPPPAPAQSLIPEIGAKPAS
jgi:hypothetical protein